MWLVMYFAEQKLIFNDITTNENWRHYHASFSMGVIGGSLTLYLTSTDDMQSFLSVNSKRPSESHYLFHGRGLYHIETSALSGFYMIGIFIIK